MPPTSIHYSQPHQMTSIKQLQIQTFVEKLNAKFEDYEFDVEFGRKNARIIQSPHPGQRSCYCFVRMDDGAILKSASWKAPAKGVRAWINDVLANDLSDVDQYGSWLYRVR